MRTGRPARRALRGARAGPRAARRRRRGRRRIRSRSIRCSTESARAQLESNQATREFGYSVASAGDVNGDGYADVIVGRPATTRARADEGAAFVFLGSASGIASGGPPAPRRSSSRTRRAPSSASASPSAGDVNGDGYYDVIVGAHLYDAGSDRRGRGLRLPRQRHRESRAAAHPSPASDGSSRTRSSRAWAASVASAGDVNGDGYADVIVGPAYSAASSSKERRSSFSERERNPRRGMPCAQAQLESDQRSRQLRLQRRDGRRRERRRLRRRHRRASLNYVRRARRRGRGVRLPRKRQRGSRSGAPSAAATQTRVGPGYRRARLQRVVGRRRDDDGYADVIVGAHLYDAGRDGRRGRVRLPRQRHRDHERRPSADAHAQLEVGSGELPVSATSVATAGDVNADGYCRRGRRRCRYDAGEPTQERLSSILGQRDAASRAAAHPRRRAQLESNQAERRLRLSAWLRRATSNGDGDSDVIVGAPAPRRRRSGRRRGLRVTRAVSRSLIAGRLRRCIALRRRRSAATH